MLPNRMVLSRQTEDQLKKLKGYTGITPNVAARLAFSARWRVSFAIRLSGIVRSWMAR